MVMSLCPRFLAHPVYTFTKFLPNAPRGGQLTATVADRSHATAGSRIWNGLPDDRLHVCRIFTNISAKTESTFISIILPGHYSVTVSVISLCVLTHGRHLRSSASAALVVPPVRRSTLGDRAFRVAAPLACNSLPSTVTATPLLPAFRRQLTIFLFRPLLT